MNDEGKTASLVCFSQIFSAQAQLKTQKHWLHQPPEPVCTWSSPISPVFLSCLTLAVVLMSMQNKCRGNTGGGILIMSKSFAGNDAKGDSCFRAVPHRGPHIHKSLISGYAMNNEKEEGEWDSSWSYSGTWTDFSLAVMKILLVFVWISTQVQWTSVSSVVYSPLIDVGTDHSSVFWVWVGGGGADSCKD